MEEERLVEEEIIVEDLEEGKPVEESIRDEEK